MDGTLDSEEAARRLGIKVATLYAYVSRGLLSSYPTASGRRRRFDVEEVERLARRSRQGKAVETRMATITTGITQLSDDGPLYRGRRATDLATTRSFEEVADWLWEAPDSATSGSSDWEPLSLGTPPAATTPLDRMRWTVVMAGAQNPLRADLRPESVIRTARRVAASLIEALPIATDSGPTPTPAAPAPHGGGRWGAPAAAPQLDPGSMAARLTVRLTPEPTPTLVAGINAAMVLLADHELATSTMAVRMAASTRADVCDALLAGLATLAGPLHGGASQQAYSLLTEAERQGVERALDDALRWQGTVPGFGHSVYKRGDARFGVLHELFETVARPDQVELVRALVDLAASHSIPLPNVDLALAALSWATGMRSDAGSTVFAVARIAGWVAHYLEELEERPLRYRARAVYAVRNPDRTGVAIGHRSTRTS